MEASPPVLDVHQLAVRFQVGAHIIDAVRDVDLTVAPGEVLGIIGESGSGKTVTGMAILRLLPGNAAIHAGRLKFRGRSLLELNDLEFRDLRGVHLAMVFQNPVGSFNPAKRIGWHLHCAARRKANAKGAPPFSDADAARCLSQVGIPDPQRVLSLYPHQLSGGMLQRALIAMVLLLEPDLIIADEPTTNLDNIVERQIIGLFRKLRDKTQAGIIFITHDMSIAADLCDRIAVMYAGTIVETGSVADVFRIPAHPYTQGLVETAMELDRGTGRLKEIPGELPSPSKRPDGCLFAPRCVFAQETCWTVAPKRVALSAMHDVRCVLHA
jgi:oligopeptide/dipeptide ABC transporter ATP-binding protein